MFIKHKNYFDFEKDLENVHIFQKGIIIWKFQERKWVNCLDFEPKTIPRKLFT